MNKTVGLFNSNLLQWSLEILQPNKCVAIEAYIASLFILSCNKYIPIAMIVVLITTQQKCCNNIKQ